MSLEGRKNDMYIRFCQGENREKWNDFDVRSHLYGCNGVRFAPLDCWSHPGEPLTVRLRDGQYMLIAALCTSVQQIAVENLVECKIYCEIKKSM